MKPTHEESIVWWHRELSPLPPALRRSLAGTAVVTGLVGTLAAGIDTTIWYVAGLGLVAGGFGSAWLRGYLGTRPVQAFQSALLLLWLLATIRWCLTDELALGFWGAATGILLLIQIRKDRQSAGRLKSHGP